jgi:hypothetical protein
LLLFLTFFAAVHSSTFVLTAAKSCADSFSRSLKKVPVAEEAKRRETAVRTEETRQAEEDDPAARDTARRNMVSKEVRTV